MSVLTISMRINSIIASVLRDNNGFSKHRVMTIDEIFKGIAEYYKLIESLDGLVRQERIDEINMQYAIAINNNAIYQRFMCIG